MIWCGLKQIHMNKQAALCKQSGGKNNKLAGTTLQLMGQEEFFCPTDLGGPIDLWNETLALGFRAPGCTRACRPRDRRPRPSSLTVSGTSDHRPVNRRLEAMLTPHSTPD